MTPFVRDADFTLWHGDCLDVLRTLPDASVHMCATSPPFYGLRDYGVDGQIGLEETPDEWVARLVAVFSEVRRVLRDDGTLWVEIGDSYASASTGGAQGTTGQRASRSFTGLSLGGGVPDGLKGKDLLGQPWMLAFALRADGWYLRSEIIWHRPNPMPESVTDRPTKAHSTVFLLSKRPRYFYDADAIREAFSENTHSRGKGNGVKQDLNADSNMQTGRSNRSFGDATRTVLGALPPQAETLDGSDGEAPRGHDGRRATAVEGREHSEQHRNGERWPNPSGANARSVWRIPTEPTPFAHFATWPQKLVERMILAGTSEKGCCPECGSPWERETTVDYTRERPGLDGGGRTRKIAAPDDDRANGNPKLRRHTETIGWQPGCGCGQDTPAVPCTVLDPFGGSGTTAVVARRLGRASTLIELNADYCALAAKRLSQQSLLAGDAA